MSTIYAATARKPPVPTASKLPSRLTQPTASSSIKHASTVKRATDENSGATHNKPTPPPASVKPKTSGTSAKPPVPVSTNATASTSTSTGTSTGTRSVRVQVDDLEDPRIGTLQAELSATQSSFDHLIAQNQALQSTLNDKDTAIGNLQSQLEEAKSSNEVVINNLKKQISLLEWKLTDTGIDIVTLSLPETLTMDSDSHGVRVHDNIVSRAQSLHDRVNRKFESMSLMQSKLRSTPTNTPRASVTGHARTMSQCIVGTGVTTGTIIEEGPLIECDSDISSRSSDSSADISILNDTVTTTTSSINDSDIQVELVDSAFVRESTGHMDRSYTESEIFASAW